MIPTARQLLFDTNPRLGQESATRDLMEKEFFSSIRLSNRVFKTTSVRRLDDVNQTLIAVFQKLGVAPTTFLDIAISSGTSTIEWVESLQQAGLRPHMTATDLTTIAYLVRLFRGCHVLVDKEGFPLQYDVFGIALRPWCPVRYYIFGNYFLTVMYRFVYWRLAQRLHLLKRLEALRGKAPPGDDPVVKAQVKLVSYRLRNKKEIELLDDDITEPTPSHLKRRFQVVRAANILNRNYFSTRQLVEGAKNLRDRMSGPGAFLLIVRTEDRGGNHGTVFRLNDYGSLEVVARIGRGSEIEDIVLCT